MIRSKSWTARSAVALSTALVASLLPVGGLLPMGTVSASDPVTWEVQSDYFAERNAIAQPRTIRSMALSHDGSSVYTGTIQSPNVFTNTLTKVSSNVLAVAGTDHVIFGNGRPDGTGGFGPVGGQPVYAGGATGTFHAWTATGNSPRGLATDDRGYVYAALSSGISSANIVRIYNADLSSTLGNLPVATATGVAIHADDGTYWAYVANDSSLRRWNVTNAASPVLDATWTPPVFSGSMDLTVDDDGTVFLAGGGLVRRISADGTTVTDSTAITGAVDVAVFRSKVYVVTNSSFEVWVLNKADLSSAGPNLVVPDLQVSEGRARGTIAQFTAIDVDANGRLYISEENYTAGSGGITSYTPPVTSFNPTPGPITGRIYFDRVLVSSAVAEPNTSPVVVPPADQAAVKGELMAFDLGSFTDEVGDGPWQVDVDWGDGNGASFAVTDQGNLGTLDHTYTDGPDIFTVEVCVTDEDNATACATFDVTVTVASAQGVKGEVIDALQDLLTGDKKTDKDILKAIKAIDKSLDDKYWADDDTPADKGGKKIFDNEKKAVQTLMKIKDPGPGIQDAIDALVGVDRGFAETAITDAIDRGGDAKRIAKAQEELAKGDNEAANGKPDKAIDCYKKAWEEAVKA